MHRTKMTVSVSHLAALLAACTLVGSTLVGCSGRDPLVSEKNAAAPIGNEGEGEGEGEPPPRTLTERTLFGTLPVENRFLDPLFTMGGSGWYALASDFSAYGVFYTRPIDSPTKTRALELAGRSENPRGVMLLGQYKTGRAPQTVSIWVGHSTDLADLSAVSVSLYGLFVDNGEAAVDLEPDAATSRTIGTTTWVQYSAVMEEGPIGWANFIVDSQATASVFVSGPLAVDTANLGAGALIRTAPRRAATAAEQTAASYLAERNRDRIGGPIAQQRAMAANSARRTR